MTNKDLLKSELFETGYVSRNQVIFHQKLGVPMLEIRARFSDIRKEGVRIETDWGKALNKKLGENKFGDGDFIYYIPSRLGL